MTPLLRVVAPGLFTTVQDRGRRGFAAVGLPTSGPLDPDALRLAGALVGNGPDAPGLEILVAGPTLEVLAPSVRIAFVGGAGGLVVGDRPLAGGRSVRLERGERVRVGPPVGQSCGYLAVEGGLAARRSFGSASTYAKAGFGGFEGRPLRAGDVLGGPLAEAAPRAERRLGSPPPDTAESPVRVVLGPQDDHFTPEAVATFLSATWRVTNDADRMGFRLDGPALAHARGADIVSDGVVSGSVQVPGSGRPVVLMRDNGTAGGYPKIATVISPDVAVLGRRGPGAAVRFAAVSRREGEAAARAGAAALAAALADLRDVAPEAALDLDALYAGAAADAAVDALAP